VFLVKRNKDNKGEFSRFHWNALRSNPGNRQENKEVSGHNRDAMFPCVMAKKPDAEII
jgi:hypothetical protein